MNKKLKRAQLEDLKTAMSLNRRDFIYGMGASLGSVALAGMMSAQANAAKSAPGPLALKKPHHPPRAKNCIFLMMEGGPSHIDTFDPKPMLNDLHRQRFTQTGEAQSAMELGTRYYVRSPLEGASSRSVGRLDERALAAPVRCRR